jgi:NAD+ kinase
MLSYDKRNPAAREIAQQCLALPEWTNAYHLVIGGDGFLLETVLQTWQQELPYLGINAGHRGFLLNDRSLIAELLSSQKPEIIHQHSRLLAVTIYDGPDQSRQVLGFNDAWVERIHTQTAWLSVQINGRTEIAKMVADGALVATPAGSTAYAAAMGAAPLPLDAQVLTLVGSNVSEPKRFTAAHLPSTAHIRIETIGSHKRPVRAVVDGVSYGEAHAIEVEYHPTAVVTLAFIGDQSLHQKLIDLQFAH